MKRMIQRPSIFRCWGAYPLLFLCLGFTASALPQPPEASLNDLAWLAGCWETDRGASYSQEQWMKPAGEIMIGMARNVKNGKTVEFEFLRIHKEQGRIYYTAKPSGQAETSFKLKSSTADGVVFEDLQHDFPQRIIYRQQPDGSLLARVEGERNGKLTGIDYHFKRGKCE